MRYIFSEACQREINDSEKKEGSKKDVSSHVYGKLFNRMVFFLLLCGFLLNLFLLIFHHDFYLKFLEDYISHGGHIIKPTEAFLRLQVFFITTLFGWHVLITRARFLKESFEELSLLNKSFYIIALLLCVSYHFFNRTYLYEEDGVFEYLTAILALVSSVMLLIWTVRRKKEVALTLGLSLSIILFLFGMEELSWGQRIFLLETPQAFQKINMQGEINIHNISIFNRYLELLTQLFVLFMAVFLIYSKELKQWVLSFSIIKKCAEFVPPPNFIVYGFLFLLLSIYNGYKSSELWEEIFAFFFFVYACNLFVPSKKATATIQ